MRLHKLIPEQIEAWRKRRAEVGREKYGDAHLQRYGLVDVMEEQLDSLNILDLWADRAMKACFTPDEVYEHATVLSLLEYLRDGILRSIVLLVALDKHLPDHLCTDELGGERVWWSEQVGAQGTDPGTTTYRQADPESDGYWECDRCGGKWTFTGGGPTENNMHYCPECGRRITSVVSWEEQADYTPCPACEEPPAWCGCEEGGGGLQHLTLTKDDCNVLMHGLRMANDVELTDEARSSYAELVNKIIDVGVGWVPEKRGGGDG